MQQRMKHARILADRQILLRHIPKGCVTCEVGAAFGEFSRKIFDTIQPERHYIIDSWAHADRYDDAAFLAVLKEFRQEIRAGRVNLLRMDSVAGMTELPDAGIDFLYIDTNHTYQTTKRELETAHVKVRSSGFIAEHDFSPGRFDEQNCCFIHYGVIEAVREFMKKYDYDLHYLTLDEDIPYSFALKQSSR